MRFKFVIYLILICALCVSLQAQETKSIICDKPSNANDYKKWLEKDVLYIITKDEKESFLKLNTNEEREIFIQNFWLRRDPTPNTKENEFFDEYYNRIAYTNEIFSSGIPGWRTDRGFIYISYGKPDSIERGRADFANLKNVLFEKWSYKNLDGLCSEMDFTFIDPMESKEFRLQADNREKLLKSGEQGLIIYFGGNPCQQTSF